MNTALPISTISFNSEPFLRAKLQELTESHIVSFWAYIMHDPEPDEGDEAGKKSHAHVYIEPSKRLNTDNLRAQFLEPDLLHPEKKPKGVIFFRNSKFPDWFLYGMHDASYLAKKEQGRVHHYSEAQFVFSNEDDWRFLVSSVDRLQLSAYDKMRDAMLAGVTFAEYMARGTIPIQQLALHEKAWIIMETNLFTRNGRKGHPELINNLTGEVCELPENAPWPALDPKDELPY